MIINIWVNDLAIVRPDLSQVKKFKKDFEYIFKIKDLGEIKKILNIKITRNRFNRIIFFN
jgi:TnpA family transposase